MGSRCAHVEGVESGSTLDATRPVGNSPFVRTSQSLSPAITGSLKACFATGRDYKILAKTLISLVGAQGERISFDSQALAEGEGKKAPIDGQGTISGAALTRKQRDRGAR
jgi:hypothetical protein